MNMDNFIFEMGSEPDVDLLNQITGNLLKFNYSKIGNYHYEDLSIVVRKSDKNLAGGLLGRTGLGWLYIDILWISDPFRGSGIGSRILAEAEKISLKRECTGAYLYTYSFQNPEFYKARGYVTIGEIPDFPHGHTKYVMKKKFK